MTMEGYRPKTLKEAVELKARYGKDSYGPMTSFCYAVYSVEVDIVVPDAPRECAGSHSSNPRDLHDRVTTQVA